MTTQTQSGSGGIGLGGALVIVFVTLKLCNVIDWSWWWVLSPIWIVAGICSFFLITALIGHWITRPQNTR